MVQRMRGATRRGIITATHDIMDFPPPSQPSSQRNPSVESAPSTERSETLAPRSQRMRPPPPKGCYGRWERPYLNFPQARIACRNAGPKLRGPRH